MGCDGNRGMGGRQPSEFHRSTDYPKVGAREQRGGLAPHAPKKERKRESERERKEGRERERERERVSGRFFDACRSRLESTLSR